MNQILTALLAWLGGWGMNLYECILSQILWMIYVKVLTMLQEIATSSLLVEEFLWVSGIWFAVLWKKKVTFIFGG